MLAKPPPGLEQKLIDRVETQFRRIQGIDKGLFTVKIEGVLYIVAIARRGGAPLPGELTTARIGMGR